MIKGPVIFVSINGVMPDEKQKRHDIHPDPITLYRVARENWLFSTRHDPVAPRECKSIER